VISPTATQIPIPCPVRATNRTDRVARIVGGVTNQIAGWQSARGGRWPTGPVTEECNYRDMRYAALQVWTTERFPFTRPH
jgi:hypothetical protein